MQASIDYLIVGQGLAGSLLAFELLERGKSVRIIDRGHQGAAFAVAAGIINPITGRRFAKSWRIDEFLPFARTYYQALEQRFSKTFFYERSILRFLQGNKDINDWYGRSSWEGFEQYMKVYESMEDLAELFHLPFGMGKIQPAAQVNLLELVTCFQTYFTQKGILDRRALDTALLNEATLSDLKAQYQAKQIIFCEGQAARFNPLFQAIPFEPAKGEVLILKIPDLKLEYLIKNKLMIAPLGEDLYWTGSNYEWNSTHDQPTQAFRSDFIKKLRKTLKLPFEVIDHKAAIRPTMKDRRPVLGIHPRYSDIAIFNGLGTKGASLGPFWAKEMVAYLIDNKTLAPEVDIRRFL